jgi:PqqD family protein of HPr-rel-A system
MQWRVIGDSALQFRSWNGEFVVYNSLSGDTHILEESTAQILLVLQQTPSDMLSLAQLLARMWECELCDDFLLEIEMVLSDMHTLSLVERA